VKLASEKALLCPWWRLRSYWAQ